MAIETDFKIVAMMIWISSKHNWSLNFILLAMNTEQKIINSLIT